MSTAIKPIIRQQSVIVVDQNEFITASSKVLVVERIFLYYSQFPSFADMKSQMQYLWNFLPDHVTFGVPSVVLGT